MVTKTKTPQEITFMREGGKMLATVLELLRNELTVGMSTKDLALMAAQELKALGGKPAFLGYQGYPDMLCVSVNNEVVHGIPSSKRFIQNGDIVSLDFGVLYGGMITDGAISAIAGTSSDGNRQKLVTNTERALLAGINVVKHDSRIGDIAASIQAVLDKNHFGIVRDLVGHGVGHELHEDPNIPNYGKAGTGFRLQAGMTVAIEPMATLGGHEVFIAEDGWTILTRDNSLAAHCEHTILITEQGSEILTVL